MRSKLALIGFAFAACASSAQAQQATPDLPQNGLAGAAAMAKSDPGQVSTPSASAAPAAGAAATNASPASSAPTLSDLARQGPATPVQAQPTQQVPAIAIIDTNNKAGAKANAAGERRIEVPTKISLSRISRVGFDATVILWVEGQNRRVTTGSSVLEYTVGEIREDGVCMYKSKAKTKDRCKPFLTFVKGI